MIDSLSYIALPSHLSRAGVPGPNGFNGRVGLPNWNWQAKLTLSKPRTLVRATMIGTLADDIWSTTSSLPPVIGGGQDNRTIWPLVLFGGPNQGSQFNAVPNWAHLLNPAVEPTGWTLDLYAAIGVAKQFTGGELRFVFADGLELPAYAVEGTSINAIT
jgi:hypothetical protein